MKKIKNLVFKNFIINALGILFSRVLGLVRDIILALFLGAGLFSDIFFVAIKMPAFFRRIFAEGAFAQAFLPHFTASHKKGAFTLAVLVQFSAIVFLFCLLVSLFSSFFTKIFAFGFNEETIALAAPLVAINFWYLFFIFLVTLLGSLLNYKQKFFITSFSSSFFNLCIIIAAFFIKDKDTLNTLYIFSYSIILSGLAQLILHLIALFKSPILRAMCLSVRLKRTKIRLKRFYSSFFHGVLGSSATQLSSLLDTTIASFLMAGSISYLYYANRVFQLPLALFAIALSQVAFPKILRHLKLNEESLALAFMKRAFFALFALLLLATLIGIIFAPEICKLLFERGAFTSEDSRLTALVLSAYLLGLLPFGLQRLFSLWLYAKFKQKEAAIIAFKALLISVFCSILCVLLIPKPELKVLGVALSASVSAFYLLFANLKEFGLRRFLSLFELKKFSLLIIFLLVLILFLLEFKIHIVSFFELLGIYFKDITRAVF